MHVTPADAVTGDVKPNTEPRPAAEDGIGELPAQAQPREPNTLPGLNPHVPRSRTLTLRGVTKPLFEPLPHVDDTPSGERKKPLPLPSRTFDEVSALTTTAVQGGWGANPADKNAAEPTRWSERHDHDSNVSPPPQLIETIREYEPRQRADSTLRTSLVRSAVSDVRGRVEAQSITGPNHQRTWWTAGFAALLLALACAARIPIRSTHSARGVLQSSIPGQPLTAAVAGIVREVPILAGARISTGQALIVIDPVDARTQLGQVLQRIAQLEPRQRAQRERSSAQQRTLDALRAQASALRKRYDGDAQRMARLREQRRSYERLVQHGFAAPAGLDDISQLMQGVWRDILNGEQEIANNKQQQAAIEQERTREAQALQMELKDTLAARRELEASLEHSTVFASGAGRFDGPLVSVGQRVEVGQVLARILPPQARVRAALEVSAPEHARLQVGSAATLTVDEPGAEAWSVDGQISTLNMLSELKPMADGVISPTTTLRVVVELEQDDAADAPQRLAPGTHVTAALSAVPRPLLSLAMDEWASFMETL